MINDYIKHWANLVNENIGSPMYDNPDPGLHTCNNCDMDFEGPSENGLCPNCAKKLQKGGNAFELDQQVTYDGKECKVVDFYLDDDNRTWLYSLEKIDGDEELDGIPEEELSASETTVSESSDDEWLEKYLEKNPRALESLLSWIKKKYPEKGESEQERFAKNILKKKHREGKIKDDISDVSGTSGDSKSSTVGVPRVASPEDEAVFVRDITDYGKTSSGKEVEPDNRWLMLKGISMKRTDLKRGRAQVRFYKPVGIDGDGKILLDVYAGKLKDVDRQDDGDYDDGRLHSWTRVHVVYEVDSNRRIGEETGELKDGNVVLSNGDVLEGWGRRITWTWNENSRWTSNHYRRRW